MPEGPLGFPRLTTIGPFVKPSVIQPHDTDIQEGEYSIQDIQNLQKRTGDDTAGVIPDIIRYELDNSNELNLFDVIFKYHKQQIGDILEVNEFSSALLKAMSKAEQNNIPLEAEEVGRMEIKNDKLENEVRNHMDGKQSMFTDELLGNVDNTWLRLKKGDLFYKTSESEMRDEILSKVMSDFNRVTNINEKIRSDNIYFPPTIENIELGAPAGWGTLDGAHRLVALSQILGTDESIYVWEWINEDEFTV